MFQEPINKGYNTILTSLFVSLMKKPILAYAAF